MIIVKYCQEKQLAARRQQEMQHMAQQGAIILGGAQTYNNQGLAQVSHAYSQPTYPEPGHQSNQANNYPSPGNYPQPGNYPSHGGYPADHLHAYPSNTNEQPPSYDEVISK